MVENELSWRMPDRSQLGALADPSQFTEPLDIGERDVQVLLDALRSMLEIRYVEEAIGRLAEDAQAGCPCHLGIGQEAIPVGISHNLRRSDRIFGAHRSHAHYLALGGDLTALICEILGKVDGCSHGMGGSMHLYSGEVGFLGSVPIVAGTVPLAVGAALAAQKDGGDDIAVVYFGDGASEEGAVHESLNLAACYKLPILFVCENNFYSSHLDIKLRQPSDRVSRFGEAHCMETKVVDGNNLLDVSDSAKHLVDKLRAGHGPAFLEAVTYRWRGHVGPKEDIDVGVRRQAGDLAAWKCRDPVERLRAGLMRTVGESALQELETHVRDCVGAAVRVADQAAYPPIEALHDWVYAGASK